MTQKLVQNRRRIIKKIVQTYGTKRERNAAHGRLTKKTELGRKKRKIVATAYRRLEGERTRLRKRHYTATP